MTTLFSGSLDISKNPKTFAAIPIAGVQGAGKTLRIDITMTGTAFPTGTTNFTIGISTDGGATYKEASGGYTAPFATDKNGQIPDQRLGFMIADTTLITHIRAKTDAPSAFTLPVTITATEV